MAQSGIPHFHNDVGASTVLIGAKEFMCIGATPPVDHPHVFIDMGAADEAICSYCGTLYKHKPSLSSFQSEPADCLWDDREKA